MGAADRAVDGVDLLASGGLVQAVEVLGHNAVEPSLRFEPGEKFVSVRGLNVRQHFDALAVKAIIIGRILVKPADIKKTIGVHVGAAVNAVGPAEIGNSCGRGKSRTAENSRGVR